MNEKMPESVTPDFKVPDKCLTCPNVLKAAREIVAHNEAVDEGIMTAVSTEPEELSALMLAVVRQADIDGTGKLTVEDLASWMRTNASQEVERLKAHAEKIRVDIEVFAAGCLGSFIMRASKDGRRDVSVTVCQSPRNPDGTREEPVTVTRSLRG